MKKEEEKKEVKKHRTVNVSLVLPERLWLISSHQPRFGQLKSLTEKKELGGFVKSDLCGKWVWGLVVVSAWARIPNHQSIIIVSLLFSSAWKPAFFFFPSLLNNWLLLTVTILLSTLHTHILLCSFLSFFFGVKK